MPAQEANEAVAAYLGYYIDTNRAFDYAVLLQGCWGSGKTYFLREFLEESATKSLYVSLYGLSSTSQI
jgi:tRNA A37 threonylcarbamoyladenosine biosynthesis protein TsaE